MDSKALHGASGLTTIRRTEKGGLDRSQPPVRPSPVLDGDAGPPPMRLTNADKNPAADKKNNNKKRKRQRRQDDAYQVAYRGFSFTPVLSTGRPGTPHSFFAESFTVQYHQDPPPAPSCNSDPHNGDDAAGDSNKIATSIRNMRVHRHANGLCVVASNGMDSNAAENGSTILHHPSDDPTTTMPMELQWLCQTMPDLSAAQKRKRVASMLKQQPQQQQQTLLPQGAVRPTDPLVIVTAKEEGIVATYPAVVFGSVLEINTELTMDLLRRDPLLKGYLAVILPSGPFPPPPSTCCVSEIDDAAAVEAESNA